MQQAVAIADEDQGGRLAEAWRGWAASERGRFVPWLPVCMASGVLLYFALGTEPVWWAGPTAALLCVLVCIPAWPSFPARAAALACLAGSLGFFSAQATSWRAAPMPALPRTAVVMTGTVRAVDVLPDGRRLVLSGVQLGDAPALDRRLRVRLKRGDASAVSAGDVVRVRALMRPPSPPAYPGGWDQQRDSFFAGLGGRRDRAQPGDGARASATLRHPRLDPVGAGRGGPAGDGGDRRAPRRDRGDVPHREHGGDPRGRPGGVPRFRARPSAGGGRAAYRHRHGAGVRGDPAWGWPAGNGRRCIGPPRRLPR